MILKIQMPSGAIELLKASSFHEWIRAPHIDAPAAAASKPSPRLSSSSRPSRKLTRKSSSAKPNLLIWAQCRLARVSGFACRSRQSVKAIGASGELSHHLTSYPWLMKPLQRPCTATGRLPDQVDSLLKFPHALTLPQLRHKASGRTSHPSL